MLVTDKREVAELKGKLKRANAAVATQKARIRKLEKGLAMLRAAAVKVLRALDGGWRKGR